MNNDKIMVSVCCLVYNHEKYLRQCLDGFITQKTNFKYEILIHDDASTDASADIIREYEQKYPDIIKPIYQTENQYSKGVKIGWEFQYPRAKGKYIALCEGDDYWCDKNKLQTQFDIMEKNADCSMCVHKVRIIRENGIDTGDYYPRSSDNIKSNMDADEMMKLFVKEGYPFHTSSYLFRRKDIIHYMRSKPLFAQSANVGDTPLMLYMITRGSFIYLDKIMSCYRTDSVNSITVNMFKKGDTVKRINSYKIGISTYILFDVYTNGKYENYIKQLIYRNEFVIAQLKKNYKQIIKKKYRSYIKSLNIKQRIYYEVVARLPFMESLYKKIKRDLNE